ncbi:hypothetical protein [uncultured Pseudoxanthomonas sp.]|uniref:hypothetical protein n=1 Tax=uncultured Pseudoxanthomonas sp. TaxID=281701 RepID=UPI00262F101A|nr:hypothetical protein [uncultured Pseudoxanthomonas sp.]
MSDEQPIQKFTKSERDAHIKRIRGYATTIADRIEKGLPLEEWQSGFVRGLKLRNDHAETVRAWARDYEPGKSVGVYPKIRDVDTAYSYVMHRAKGNAHTTTLAEIVKAYATGNAEAIDPADRFEPTRVTKLGVWKAIESLLPQVCEDLGIDPALIAERQPRGRPRKSE